MKSNTYIICGIASFSLFWTCVFCRHTRFTCEGGRGEGDKWFDGCRWCVCQISGPLCSPASCSNLVTQVPPCENVGSSWRDGCYQCKCHLYGIECVADEACIVLMQREEFLSCVEPEDSRCVCGVDGTPSCTAEVIDRNAHPATTIALDTSFNPPQRYGDDKPRDSEFRHHHGDDWGHKRVKRRSVSDEYLKRRLHVQNWYNRYKNDRRLRSSYLKPYRFFNRLGGYYNYADLANGYLNRGYHVKHKTNHMKRIHSSKKTPSSSWGDDRRRHNIDEYSQDMVNDEARSLQTPRSLLIITNNRCRYGARWYGGRLRCFCDEDGSVTCGDPQFVATRIDGFRLEKSPCEEGHAWYEEGECQVCECRVNGVVLCRRSESCPLPFLIRPVQDLTSSGEVERRSNEARSHHAGVISGSSSRKTIDRRSDLKSYSRLPLKPDEVKSIVHSDDSSDDKTIELYYDLTGKPPVIIDEEKSRKIHNIKHNKNGNKKHTTVIVTECNPGSRWLDGCKRCSCDMLGRKYCDDRRCLKPAMPRFKQFGLIDSSESTVGTGRPFQRPPVIPIIRERPVKIKSPFPEKNPCGQFKVGDKYLIKCNRCLCTPHGPKCTAINCG